MPKLTLNTSNKTNAMEQVSQKGVLCALVCKAWGNTKKIPIEKMKKISGKELSEWIRSNKGLIDGKSLEGIHAHITKARNEIRSYSLPFPIEGIYLIPKDNVMELSVKLDELIESLKIEVKDFASNYHKYIEQGKEQLGPDLFDPNDYPTDIEKRFDIQYRFLEMGVPGEFQEISPELYQKEVGKFKNMMESARNDCIIFLRQAFVKELEMMVNSLVGVTEDGKARRIREDTLDKVERFFEIFKTKNIFNDTQLLTEIENARKIMVGIEASDLRNSEKLKEHIAEQIATVAETVENGIVQYRRKLSL